MSTSRRSPAAKTSTRTSRTADQPRRGTLAIGLWAATIPILIVGQFALLAVVPVLVVLILTLRKPRLQALRLWTSGLTGTYLLALLLWALGPDRAPSLSKDLNPVVAALIIAAAVAVVLRCLAFRRG